jgi:hypothetical protein
MPGTRWDEASNQIVTLEIANNPVRLTASP